MSLLRVCTQITKGEGLHDQRSLSEKATGGRTDPAAGGDLLDLARPRSGGASPPPRWRGPIGRGGTPGRTALSAVGAEFMNAGDDPRPGRPWAGVARAEPETSLRVDHRAARRLRPRATWWDSSPRPRPRGVAAPPPPRRRGGWQVARTAAGSAAPERQRLPDGRERRRRRELGPSSDRGPFDAGCRTTAHLLHIITGVVSLWPRANDTSPIQAVVESTRMHVRTGRRRPLGRPARRQKIHTAHARGKRDMPLGTMEAIKKDLGLKGRT